MSDEIEVPGDLGADGAALFARVLADLDQGLTFDVLELERLHGAARLRDDLTDLRADIATRGRWVPGPRPDTEIPNPMIARVESVEKTINGLLSKLSVVRPEPKTGHLSRAQRNRLRDLESGVR
jgi:hypothetical protein